MDSNRENKNVNTRLVPARYICKDLHRDIRIKHSETIQHIFTEKKGTKDQ